jgi:hypothetical protein
MSFKSGMALESLMAEREESRIPVRRSNILVSLRE